jgi:hypothetical protein
MKKLIIVLAALFCVQAAYALEVAGVRFDDRTQVANGEVVANGAGLRKKAFFKVYAIALYLTERQGDAEAAINAPGAKRVAINLLRDLTAQQFVDALNEGIAQNHSEAEMAALKERVKQFSEAMLSIGEAKEGTRVLLDWLPGQGTRLSVDGQVRGRDIAGDDFYKALLRIWLGNKPVQDDLKPALLGKSG